MEGIQTINALKAVVSSLPAQTTIPSSELVMLYAADGTPIAKIARDDLVKAVASVMASNSQNTFSKLLGVQANGTPMGIGASDLASVLGGLYPRPVSSSIDLNTLKTAGSYKIMNVLPANSPSDLTDNYYATLNITCCAEGDTYDQELYVYGGSFYRRRIEGATAHPWVLVAPKYLQPYNSLASLASALGVGILKKGYGDVTSDNLDSFTEEGLYANSNGIYINNVNCGFGLLWVFKNSNTIQIFFGSNIMFRIKYAGVDTWNAWQQIQLV
jgi:hypothetical protein